MPLMWTEHRQVGELEATVLGRIAAGRAYADIAGELDVGVECVRSRIRAFVATTRLAGRALCAWAAVHASCCCGTQPVLLLHPRHHAMPRGQWRCFALLHAG